MKSLTRLALLLALLVVPLYAWKVWQKTDYTDFAVYYKAASLYADGKLNQVYDLSDGASPFRYVPISLPLFLPWVQGALRPAQLAWYFFQVLCFGLGFLVLHRSLAGACRPAERRSGFLGGILAFSMLFVLRFCLDTFTIGQISSVMFLGYALALYGWTFRRFSLAGAGLLIPSVLKIGPAFLYGMMIAARRAARRQSVKAAVLAFTLLNAFLALLLRARGFSMDSFLRLWSDWKLIVANDSAYYDSSHYGSQSLNSVLLRMGKLGWLNPEQVQLLYFGIAILVCAAILVFWSLRRPKGSHGRVLFFSLGIFPYLWFMPETFKYSLTMLAFPVGALAVVAFRRSSEVCFERVALGIGLLTLSLPGKDIVGDTVFFGMQRLSLPFAATVLLGIAVFKQSIAHSLGSSLQKTLLSILAMRRIGPWERLPPRTATLQASLLIPVQLDSLLPHPERTQTLVREILAFAEKRWGRDSEVLFLPHGSRVDEQHPVWQGLRRALNTHDPSHLGRLLPPSPEEAYDGRGYALRRGFLDSRGRFLLFFHFEQPCEPEFFDRALRLLSSEAAGELALIRANRRHAASRFKIPVSLLPVVHKRHRLGLLFNRLVRALLPVQVSDTHSGTLVMTRHLAERVFGLQSSPDFLFDLEISLIAHAHGLRETDLPVTLYLAQEKTLTRMLHETLHIMLGLPFLVFRLSQGGFGPRGKTDRQLIRSRLVFSADDWGISPGVNEGILELVRAGIVRRVSLLADAKYLEHELKSLLEFRALGRVELGLHFNLTYGKAFSSPGDFLCRWLLARSRLRGDVRRELSAQLNLLRAAGLERVDYLDGHHHIHIVPGVLDEVHDILTSARVTQVRLPYSNALWLSRHWSLGLMAFLAKRSFQRHGLQHLNFFYPKERHFLDPGLFISTLTRLDAPTEIIVHPAKRADPERWVIPDPYVAPRVTEFRALQMIPILFPEDPHG